ncbi:UNVERIFIED_CONTAM: hypothetical protein GTU68_012895 [Idotea baltica]|nr:hypothetical protein [Idotea baltica]
MALQAYSIIMLSSSLNSLPQILTTCKVTTKVSFSTPYTNGDSKKRLSSY